ncbi:acetyl/propionyl/methylcrotonyl-CoA carboxylase subunit alpha [Streptacidiphilus fuscans]|uniref:Biotin-dependent 3-methylcrotonyl-coenzyme A carboxylase alpha1 subunit n=1 Tax=Streptacidiphilus fuscans TaxID=2789292 RepID=A0A931B5F6_9ACTN|nr:biotin carboxylase N-terminal domain-containing protein [Streptacidiphilus fuscans]MBF9070526.1 acetyl/propionyl-CoA carboxylase subunit alpha [Streptacidiphilus fuscans]
MFESVLVANRGEIAVRVIRTLRRLGVRSVAVHSAADAGAPHVLAADSAVLIDSYLDGAELVGAARRAGAEAVHPGYGFLAENAGFARACAEAGLVFIGPPAEAIELMGDKIHAKEAVKAAGVPVVPGSDGDKLDDEALIAAATAIGMPVLLKPSAGGGGKGMRLVHDADRLSEEIAAARREARVSFGDDTLLVERWIDRPRHIEIQILADAHGNVVHLGERECSLQRRHQKLIEEAPSVLLDEATRAQMGAAAVRAAQSCGYTGAGTVEFIVPSSDPSSHYFMEMNTRLQVEHPVTELVTGLDLVEWQLRVAAGEVLPFAQADVTLTGHAIEARICAEDPSRGFLPSGGKVLLLQEPEGEGVRVDSGLAPGLVVGSSYDPMVSKVISYGPDRATALRRLRAALADTVVLGVVTNAGYLRRLLSHPDVVAGRLDTGLVERHPELTLAPALETGQADPTQPVDNLPLLAAALVRQVLLDPVRLAGGAERAGTAGSGWADPFARPSGWRIGGVPAWTRHQLRLPGGDPVLVEVRPDRGGSADAFEARIGGTADVAVVDGSAGGSGAGMSNASGGGTSGRGTGAVLRVAVRTDLADGQGANGGTGLVGRVAVTLDGITRPFTAAVEESSDGSGSVWLGRDGDSWLCQVHDPLADLAFGGAGAHGGSLTAPMPGTVTLVKASVGDRVTRGQAVLVLEAMKMEHVITAPHDGVVEQLKVVPGATVAMDDLLAVIAPAETSDGAAPAGESDGAATNAASTTEES